MAFSSGSGGCRSANWLSIRLAGMKWPLRAATLRGGRVAIDFEIDEPDVPARQPQPVAIDALQRRAGDDQRLALALGIRDSMAIASSQPQRSSSLNGIPPDMRSMFSGGWKLSPSAKRAPSASARAEPTTRLAAAADAHDDDDQRVAGRAAAFAWSISPVTGSPARGRRAAAWRR